MRSTLLSLFLLLYGSTSLQAQPDTVKDRKEILNLTQQFFDGLETKDSVLLNAICLPGAYHYYVVETKDSNLIAARPHTRFIQSLGANKKIVKERFRSTGVTIHIHKSIATLWGPYDLWVDEKFSHCGVDVFTLLKTKDGWKIAVVAFSVEPEECDKEIK
jgi:Putative lumazine-binding